MIWHCEANYLTCSAGHLHQTGKAGFGEDVRRMVGHGFRVCQQCHPSTFFFFIATDLPTPMRTCYEISKAQYDQWLNSVDERISSTQMLHLLGYHPNYREPVHG
jgi:hypothetical protein